MSDHEPMQPDYEVLGEAPRPQRRTGLVVGAVGAVVAAVGLPLAGFAAYNLLSGGGTQPHEVLPGNAIAYVRVDLDPSAGQKVAAVRFLQNFPEFDKTGIDDPREDIRRVVVERILAEADCDLDFESDVDPWLGERFGMAVLPGSDGQFEPEFAAAIQVRDEDAARAGIAKLAACEEESPDSSGDEGGWDYLDGYLVVGETEAKAKEYVAAARESSLADHGAFVADMERLGEQGVASAWFDGSGIFELSQDFLGAGDFGTAPDRDVAKALEQAVQESYSSGALAFRFDAGHAEVATVLSGSAYEQLPDAGAPTTALPDTTAVAFGVADGDRWIDKQWSSVLQMLAGDDDPQIMLEQLEQETGIRLPSDLQTLLGSDFVLAVDENGLTDTMRAGDPSALRVGARVETDPAEFDAVWSKVKALAASGGAPFQLAKVEADDSVAVATSEEFARTLTEGGALGDTATFQEAVVDAEEAQSYVYVDVNAFDPLLEGGPDDVVSNVRPIAAVGVSSRIHDGYAETTMRVTLD